MTINDRWGQVCATTAALLLFGAGAAMAQLESGNLYGKVKDEKGAALRDVTVILDTGEAPQVQVTDAKGEFRFLGLAPATYAIKAEKKDYSPVEDAHIVIAVGRNAHLDLTMSYGVGDVLTVFGDTPVLDPKATRNGPTISLAELQKVPTARDPWTVLQGTPGVLVDRVNVGGNQSGQQSTYVGPGSLGTQSVWSVDGVVITDMSATGSTPAYYDFDSFQEMQISTGGSDSTIATGGVVLNIVTKRGTNEYRGSARYLQVPGGTQSNTTFTANDVPAAQRSTFAGGSNKINKVEDFGGEIGGPIVKDHLWLWGSYGEQKVSVQTLPKIVPGNPTLSTPNGLTDQTKLPAWNAKLNAQITENNLLTVVGMNSSKEKQGRNAGPTRPTETTWNQGQFGGKPTLLKAEDTQIFTPNLYLTVLYSHVYGGFFLLPQSGIGDGITPAFRDNSTTWHNSFVGIEIKRPQTQEKADASTFFSTGSLSHELKYGASYRVATSVTSTGWPGGGFVLENELAGLPAGTNYLVLARTGIPRVTTKYASGYAQDTISRGNLTANVGLRYDHQGGDNGADSVPANSVRPDLLPATAFGGGPIGFTWKTWSPRAGLTYALGKDQSTLLRASYSRFADQLGTTPANWLNPFRTNSYYYAYTSFNGAPGSHLTPGQVQQTGLGWSSNVDPHDPHKFLFNTISSGVNAPLTDEILLSGEHALRPEFVVGVNLTYRKQSKLLQEDLLVFDPGTSPGNGYYGRVATRNDFTPVTVIATLPNGSTMPVTWYKLVPGLTTVHGYNLKNGDYETTFKGASLTFNKRLKDRWMLRGNVSYSDWYYSKAGDRPDPTALLAGGTTDGNYVRQGDAVLQGSGPGSGNFQNVYINSKWSFAVNGMYQIAPDKPWGFNVAGNLTGRQGYPDPYYINLPPAHLSVPNPNTGGEVVQIGAADSNRLDNIVDFDARVEKEFTFQDFGLTLGVDCFNLFNESFVLQRQGKFTGTTAPVSLNAGFVNEVLSPRVFRFGARLSFK